MGRLSFLADNRAIAYGLLALGVNVVLMAIKIVVGLVGNSYALVADGIESAADVVSSLITWTAFHLSLRPADERHPFGHGKIESLAGIFSGGAILAAAFVIAWHSLHEIRTPHHGPAWFTLPVLIAVVIVKVIVSRQIQRFGETIDSRAVEGDAWHHLSDAITSGAAAVGISIALIGGPGWESADDYAALLACLIIVTNGVLIIKRSVHEVLDGRVNPQHIDAILATGESVPGVDHVEKCRVRKSGIGLFVELHVRVDGETTVRIGHEIGHQVKDTIQQKFPQVLDVVIHLEPSPRE